MEKLKINALEFENVKRIKAVKLELTQNGLTVIGGKNKQGKTSVLDAIAWALGGNKFKPSEPHREGSMVDPILRLELSNGIIVERKGKNSDLKVTDPNGNKAGQALLDSFIEELALNLPKFMESTSKEKANTLLQIIGIGPQLAQLEMEYKKLYQERLFTGQLRDQKKKYADELKEYPSAPKELISINELISQQQTILAKNGENQRKRDNLKMYEFNLQQEQNKLLELEQKVQEQREKVNQTKENVDIARRTAQDLQDESTIELEENIKNIELINNQVRANLDKEKAQEEAKELDSKYTNFTNQLKQINETKMNLLNGADLPLPDLSVEDGELVYKGQKWDNMSGAEQLQVSAAIVRKLKPQCGFVLLDKLEQMDTEELSKFSAWLEQEGLQAIATRVSTGDECSVIIEDGYGELTLEENKVKTEQVIPAPNINSFDW